MKTDSIGICYVPIVKIFFLIDRRQLWTSNHIVIDTYLF